jgi:hypothetical protein
MEMVQFVSMWVVVCFFMSVVVWMRSFIVTTILNSDCGQHFYCKVKFYPKFLSKSMLHNS